jgi:hypothetical protein
MAGSNGVSQANSVTGSNAATNSNAANNSKSPAANLVAGATDPRTGRVDTQALGKMVADAAKVDFKAASAAYNQIESRLSVGDASRFAQDVRAASKGEKIEGTSSKHITNELSSSQQTRGRKLSRVLTELQIDTGTKASLKSIADSAQALTDKYNKEIAYAVFKHSEKDTFEVRTAVGYLDEKGRPVVELDLTPPKGDELTATGHAHNWTVGGLKNNIFGWSSGDKHAKAGPSPDDVAVTKKFPDVVFLLHQKRYGTGWETTNYGKQ